APPMRYTFIDNVILGSINMDRLQEAIDALQDQGEHFAESDLYAEALDLMADDPVAFSVVNVEPLLEMFVGTMTESFEYMMEEVPDLDAIMDVLGMADMRTLVASAEFRDDAVASIDAVLLMDERQGLFTLIPDQPVTFEAPSFVPDDAMSFSASVVDFTALLPLAEEIIDVLPAEMADTFTMQLQTARQMVGPFFEAIGPEVVNWTTLQRPLQADSERGTYAIRITDDLVVQNSVSLLANLGGLDARDFEGGVIYESEFGGPTLGIGGNWLFIGDAQRVEDALRADGAPRVREGDEPLRPFHDADARVVGVIDLGAMLEMEYYAMEHEVENLRAQWKEMGFEDEDIEMFLEGYEATDMSEVPPLECLLDHLSELSTTMHAEDGAIRIRMIVH
ncbi:MAG: hypothetical protein KDA28_16650, partial [Phycisphaerales bacterium]|nr:hypothetical protein [Phycisphaerales bacterium]